MYKYNTNVKQLNTLLNLYSAIPRNVIIVCLFFACAYLLLSNVIGISQK